MKHRNSFASLMVKFVTNVVNLTKVHGQKSWIDNNDQQGNRPDEVSIELYANSKLVDTQKTTAQKKWRYEFNNLPMIENGKIIDYSVKEQPINDYLAEYDGYNITNFYVPELVQVLAKNKWNDHNDQDGMRPSYVIIQLKKDGRSIGNPITLSEENNWSYAWDSLEKREYGKEVYYSVEKISDSDAYVMKTMKKNDYHFILTNHYTPEIVTVYGNIEWADNYNAKGNRPFKTTVELYANGEFICDQGVSEKESWKYNFINLPKNKNGKPINYTVNQLPVEDYQVSYADHTIINMYYPKLTNVSIINKWDDANNQDGIRPSTLLIQLQGNGQPIGDFISLSEKENWRYVWQDLEIYRNNEYIDYTVDVLSDFGKYSSKMVKKGDYQITLTNSYTPEETKISGTKHWHDSDDQDGMRPDEIKLHLIANNQLIPVMTQIVVPDEQGDWHYEFNGLAKKEKGTDIVYSIKEEAVLGYDFSAEQLRDTTILDSTNTHAVRKTHISVIKEWHDANNQDGVRPEMIYVQLLADNKKITSPIELNESNHWSYIWKDLNERKAGNIIDYQIEELTAIPEYKSSLKKLDDHLIVLSNSHITEQTEVSGKVTWEDLNNEEGQRPDHVVIHLYGDSQEVEKKIVTADEDWTYSFTDLPKNNNGVEIKYTVDGEVIMDYTTTMDGTDIINRYTPGITNVNVTKKWIDDNDQDGIRPNKILVQLNADGVPFGSPIELNDQNDWTYTWNDLVAKAFGKVIDYKVTEVNVPKSYSVKVTKKRL